MAKANLLGKRNREDDLEIKKRVELVEIKSDETNFMKAAIREKTLFVTNLNPHAHKSHIIKFFKNIGKVVRVQLAVNFKVNQVGYGYVEFVSANEAKKVLQNKNGEYFAGRNIVLAMLPRYTPRPQPKYCIDHKIRYGEREKLPIEEDETLPDFVKDVM
ncbi:Nucleolin 2 [Cardamine amara subsp. amara]|uniref:Nucleolin 2 n=1 Tax=Cardamine amara subsp. amara TaxID=228776 RepID=A0ABD1AI40_CARAN